MANTFFPLVIVVVLDEQQIGKNDWYLASRFKNSLTCRQNFARFKIAELLVNSRRPVNFICRVAMHFHPPCIIFS